MPPPEKQKGAAAFQNAVRVVFVLLLAYYFLPVIYRYWTHRRYLVSRAQPVTSRLDGMEYHVHGSHEYSQAASDKLAFLHSLIIQLLEHLDRKYQASSLSAEMNSGPSTTLPSQVVAAGKTYNPEMREMYPERFEIVQNILRRYNPDRLVESSPQNPEGDTSFTLFKGALLAICLREKEPHLTGDPAVHDIHNTTLLWFVTVHELAHLGIDASGHPPEFWSCFKFLLKECEEAQLVPPTDATARALARGDESYKDQKWPGQQWPNYEMQPVRYCGLEVDYNPVFDAFVLTPV